MVPKKSILVTGGAGYIGSHVVLQLGQLDEKLVVLDNLSTGFSNAVLHGELIIGNTGDRGLIRHILEKYDVDSVIHFAASTIVPESVQDPLKYYQNNTCSTRNLLECCRDANVSHFIFSSTAAVYGVPRDGYCGEDSPTAPINPYGTSKLMTETMLRDLSCSSDLRHVVLRYFNVAGSDPAGRIGQSTEKATLLIKVACEAAVGKRPYISIYGTDYETPDGTGIRDYIHVDDLASAHVSALQYLREGGRSTTLNCGYGRGHSVRQVLEIVGELNGESLDIRQKDRRPGDPPTLIAKADLIRKTIGWQPQYDDLRIIVDSSLNWERHLLNQNRK